MTYPLRLIPKKNDPLIESFFPNEYLVRGVNEKYALRDETGQLSALAIEEIRIPGYSTNKIPPSLSEDINIILLNTAKSLQPWNPGDDVYMPEDNEFTINTNRQKFFIRIVDICGYEGKYPFPANEKKNKFNFIVSVIHKPLKSNYAHFELQISYFDSQNKSQSKTSKKSQKLINATIRSKLIEIAQFNLSA